MIWFKGELVGNGSYHYLYLGSRQEYWNGVPFPTPGDLVNPGIEPTSLGSPALAGKFFTTSATWEIPEYLGSKKCHDQIYIFRQSACFVKNWVWKGGSKYRNQEVDQKRENVGLA